MSGGRNPDFFSIGGYDGMHAIYETLKKTRRQDRRRGADRRRQGPEVGEPARPDDDRPRDARRGAERLHPPRARRSSGELVNVVFDTIPMVKDPAGERRKQAAAKQSSRADAFVGRRRALRRVRLRDAAVPAVGGAVGDAGDDELRQPGALQLRHGRRLRHRHARQPLRLAVPRHAADGVPRRRGRFRRPGKNSCSGGSTARATSTSAC